MKTITILLSTYNGEKFIREQIDSLLAQEGVDLRVLARDDGSSDSTLSILESYKVKDNRFDYFLGKNMGPANSFLDLSRNAPETDYYAFADQDDVWDPNKLANAIELLEAEDQTIPLVYYSNLRIVDQDLNFYRMSHAAPKVIHNKYASIIENMATGCTMVYNATTAKLLREHVPDYCTMHDAWVFLLCSIMGKTVYDFNAYISYRQHGNNVVGAHLKKPTLNTYVKRIKRMFDKSVQPRYYNAVHFLEAFGDLLCETDRVKLSILADYKRSFSARLRLFFDKDLRGATTLSDLRYRILILFGVV